MAMEYPPLVEFVDGFPPKTLCDIAMFPRGHSS